MKADQIAKCFFHRPWMWLGIFLLTVVPAVWLASQLELKSDFKRLLPQNKPSVVTLNRIVEKVGGIGNLVVAIECDDYKATERFIDDLVVELRKLPKKYVRYIEYNSKDVRQFYSKNKYLYIELNDLREIHKRLARKIRYEKLRQNPFFIALEEDTVEFDVSDIEAKYKKQTSKYDDYLDGYFFGENGKLAAVLVQPFGTSTGIKFSKDLIARVIKVIYQLDPSKYHSSMKVTITGKYPRVLDEYDQLIRDVLETLALCLFLVAFAIYLYFLKLRVIWLLTIPLGMGALWTFALTQWQIGYLNSQTAFLGSIIVGNGVNSGIIFLARYLEERRREKNIDEALRTAYSTTWLGTFSAAITTSAAFAALSLSEIKGFSQFGFIGGFGMILCWVATYTVLPPMLVLSERILPFVKTNRKASRQWEFIFYPVGSMVAHSPRLIAGFGIFLFLGSLALATRYLPNSLEYDFSKLKNRPINPQLIGKGMNDRVKKIFGQHLSPAVILLDNENQAKYVCDSVMKQEAHLPDHEKTIDSCKTLRSYLPEDQVKKLVVLGEIRKLLADNSINFAKPEYRKEIDEFRKEVNLRKIYLKNIPQSIRRNFRELDGRLGRIVYVYPRASANLSNGKELMQFADMLSNVRLKDGSVVSMSGESAIFADLLRTVEKDGPKTTLFSFLAVSLLIILNFRKKRPIIYVLGGLIVGVTLMLGLQSILQIRLNFFNFIALPVTFGIGVDYGVNLLQRYKLEGRGSVRRVLGTVGGAIFLCSTTTIIGYATLLTASNQALASFGWLALIGEIACIFAGIVIMPALLHSFDRRLQTVPNSFEEKRKVESS